MASDKMLGSFDQKSAPEDNDLLVEYDAAASKVKNVKFGGVWNWIVKKLTSAVINELQTSSKNVVGAINELNSKTLKYRGSITGTTTLEEYCADNSKLPGYYKVNGAIISGISNMEQNTGKVYGALILFSTTFDLQILIVGGGQIYARDYTGSPVAWTKWSKYTRTLLS